MERLMGRSRAFDSPFPGRTVTLEKRPGAAATGSLDGESVKILVVDDHPENLLSLQSVLAQPDYDIVEAASGIEALKLVLRHQFAVILLDVMMPDMDGIETARLIRDREASKDVPIIFLTANDADAAFIAMGYSVGAVDYLVKPVEPHIVRAKVAVFVDLFRRERRIVEREALLRAAERERGEQALRDSEALYEATVEAAPVGIAHQGADGRWLRANDKFCDILGYPREELLRLTYHDVALSDDVVTDTAALSTILSGESETYRREKRYRRKDGSLVWVHVTVSLARSDREARRHFIVVAEDISERKLTEERRLLLSVASDTLLSSLDYEATLANVARLAVPKLADWCIVDVGSDDVGPKELAVAHADPDKVDRVRDLHARLRDDPTSGPSEVLRTMKALVFDEAERSLFPGKASDAAARARVDDVGLASSMVVPLIARKHVLGTITLGLRDRRRRYGDADLVTAEDLAHRVAFGLDNARLYRQAQNAIEARNEFLSIASHELRTPLTPLMIILHRLLDPAGREPLEAIAPERLRAMLTRSERQVQRLVTLIDSLLDVSRISSGSIRLQPQPLDLAELAREVGARFADELAKAGCPLRLSADEPVCGVWDKLRLEQVLTNLLGNATKYGAGGPIEIKVERSGELAVLQVRDHGIGIEPDKVGRIFDRFERAVSSRSYGGLGLGLYIARQIIESHGGSIRVASTMGTGSTFTIELPVLTVERDTETRLSSRKAPPHDLGIRSE